MNAPAPAPVTPPDRRDDDPLWFQRAVFYEVLVRSFHDSTGDGIGDLAGLTSKLDYLAWLGVDCLWLPPFFPSPLRDGGYDVADYTSVSPELGSVDDFKVLLDAAHARGIRIIIDVVMNHTSDQHPWFQASRNDPDGPYGDFYVWHDTDEAYSDTRIIFVDTEASNWTHDPVRGQYYWHRFYSHQPDLNFENPAVHDAMIDALTFWLEMGVDGFRLDAVPYLYEEEARTARTSRRRTTSSRRSAATSTTTTRAACCSPRRTSGPPTSWTTSAIPRSAATSATCASTSP